MQDFYIFDVKYSGMRHLYFISLYLAFTAMVLSLQPFTLIGQDSIPGDFCISEKEYKLYNLINDYRKAMNLEGITLSKTLSYVARRHALDLATNRPDTNTCNFHSWSDKGAWKACCYEKDLKDNSCMTSKPSEITNYKGKAWEIIYWENSNATPERAFEQWRETNIARSLITNFKEWESFDWVTAGFAIYEGFAIAWFGEDEDPEMSVKICETGKTISYKPAKKQEEEEIISQPMNRYYLIFGSFSSLEDAKSELNKYKTEGFKRAKIVAKDEKYRISLADYPDPDLAAQAKKELPAKYKNAWVLTY